MIITYLRSSSINSYDFCPFKNVMEYSLGIPSNSNKKANKGNVCHKVMEALALFKDALNKKKKEYSLPDIGTFSTKSQPDIAELTKLSYNHYKGLAEYCDWNENDLGECIDWVRQTMEYDNGAYNPLKCDIFGVEQFFDISIMEDWAQYDFKDPHTGKQIEGFLSIKGNIDFIFKRSESHLSLTDWKYGKKVNWTTNPPKPKSYQDLVNDNQLLLYTYAMHELFPQYEFDQTIFYVLDGGPVTIPRGEEDVEKAKLMLRKYFEKMKSDKMPQKNVSFKCKRMCHFGMTLQEGTDETICNHIHAEMVENGLYQVMREYGKPGYFNSYGSGGGKTEK